MRCVTTEETKIVAGENLRRVWSNKETLTFLKLKNIVSLMFSTFFFPRRSCKKLISRLCSLLPPVVTFYCQPTEGREMQLRTPASEP